MVWTKITIDTTNEAADIVASVLFDNNIVGVEIEDNQNLTNDELSKMYVDIPKFNVDDGKAKVSFYVSIGKVHKIQNNKIDKSLVDNSYMPSNDNIFTEDEFNLIYKNIIKDLDEYKNFVDMGTLKISKIKVNDEDFIKKWKESFKKIEIDDIKILPSWEKLDNDINSIYIEPGSAFGTGQHSTTKLCIKFLKKIMSNRNINYVLDIGCGSGILSIVSSFFGAKKVFAIDVDKSIESNLIENIKLNNISKESITYEFGNILTDIDFKNKIKNQRYDIIVANILSPVIISLIEKCKIQDMLSDNGHLILSGIIKDKEMEVKETIKKNISYKNLTLDYDEEWVAFKIDV